MQCLIPSSLLYSPFLPGPLFHSFQRADQALLQLKKGTTNDCCLAFAYECAWGPQAKMHASMHCNTALAGCLSMTNFRAKRSQIPTYSQAGQWKCSVHVSREYMMAAVTKIHQKSYRRAIGNVNSTMPVSMLTLMKIGAPRQMMALISSSK